MSPKVLWATLIGVVAAVAPAAATTPVRELLPSGVVPISYDLALVPDATNLRFAGHVKINVKVNQPTRSIVLNADELIFDKAVIDAKESPGSIGLDPKLQRATITFAHSIAPGNHILTIDYHGVIGKATDGFFAMDYDSQAGKRRTITTNFEPAYERRFMPSWDEPAYKATFSLSVDIPADVTAIANMPVASTETLKDGYKRVKFVRTPKMSTYLYFLGIGDFERISTKVDGTDVGVVVNRGDAEKGRFALQEAARLLHYYNEYFGVPFPLPKLDLVVAPGSVDGGSMENWGAILYSQSQLLVDPAKSTEAARQGVFLVVSHEMAHQWFGDLVTMAWWDDLWLNEGFARWMQTKAADDLHPGWKSGLQALAISENGKRADAKPSTHPIVQSVLNADQAAQAFDDITYDKGAAVIRMLEAYVGSDAFRNGVRRYMRGHAYGTTVDLDFWREVQAVAGKPILKMEADFTRQAGVPLLRAEMAAAGASAPRLYLTEGRFVEDSTTIASAPVQTWHAPVAVSAGGEPTTHVLSDASPTSFPIQGKGPVIVNAGQTAYARVQYPNSMIESLTGHIPALQPTDQLGLLYDSWALGQAGYTPATNYLALARSIPAAADPVVWIQIASTLYTIDRAYAEGPAHEAFRAFARQILNPVASRLTWEPHPDEESNAAMLRDAVLRALSRFGDHVVIEEGRRRFEMAVAHPEDVSPAVRRTVISIVARNADGAALERLFSIIRSTKDPLEKQNLFWALEGIADPTGAGRVLDVALGPDGPSGTALEALANVALNHPDLAWNRALKQVERPDFPFNDQQRAQLMTAIAGNFNDASRIADLEAYADKHIPANVRQGVVEAIARINLNAKFRAQRLPEIEQWLAGKASPERGPR